VFPWWNESTPKKGFYERIDLCSLVVGADWIGRLSIRKQALLVIAHGPSSPSQPLQNSSQNPQADRDFHGHDPLKRAVSLP
jgi:hypothetical protein